MGGGGGVKIIWGEYYLLLHFHYFIYLETATTQKSKMWWWWWGIVFVVRLTNKRRFALPYFQQGPLSKFLTIASLWHAASRVWTCAEPEFRLSRMKLYSSDNHYKCECIRSCYLWTSSIYSKSPIEKLHCLCLRRQLLWKKCYLRHIFQAIIVML